MTPAAARLAAAALLAALALLLAPALTGAQTPAVTGTGATSVAVPPPLVSSTPLGGSQTPLATTTTTATARATDPNALATPPSPSIPPPGFRLTSRQATAIADAVPKIRRVVAEHPGAYPTAYTKGTAQWQVSYFDRKRSEIGQVTLDDLTGAVREAWTGYQVPWTMARGYEGAFGRRVNAWYVWVPLCLLFVAPFLPWRRRPSWLHLDLLVLLSFSVSLAFFNHARIGLSTPLIYPPLLYLIARMLVVARRGGRPEPLRLLVPVSWLAVALVFLIGFRVGLNVTNSNVIDVGYSGVIGANKLVDGEPLYGGWPTDNAHGDTYGPVNYLAYVPFERIFGWSGRWDDLPAAHAAAVVFDLLTIGALFLLGRRIRGPSLGIVFAYLWAAFPFTLYVSNTNGNDALVALLLVCTLLVAARPGARGALTALGGLTKFASLALAPLFMRTPIDAVPRGAAVARRGPRAFLGYALGFLVAAAVAMLPVILEGNWSTFLDHTLAFQRDRGSPFSIWGLWDGLDTVQTAVQLAAVLFALSLAFCWRQRTLVQTAALGAVVLIALQLSLTYWFYLYLVWFFPFVIVALFGRYGDPGSPPPAAASGSAEAGGGGHEQLFDPVGAQR
ncbi:glycosyltransferase family 87 protein [Conexibacter stalactiti]|uniref:Glycosyltransferase family 87 protein n=1 Tax=Conexibacter stalactiti TaxID=1940611 RepID=A0ABU4HIX4_9ACTN|nr:glycosyltransferase family 87 protein [Conexibacter stalactiti]MDW5593266.1 glycosyltransferase family 87 protein [Conexibacter stalactiti]MEC5033907.1 glycosyltransferase family 87 protein [Conexibacter stalactiti]